MRLSKWIAGLVVGLCCPYNNIAQTISCGNTLTISQNGSNGYIAPQSNGTYTYNIYSLIQIGSSYGSGSATVTANPAAQTILTARDEVDLGTNFYFDGTQGGSLNASVNSSICAPSVSYTPLNNGTNQNINLALPVGVVDGIAGVTNGAANYTIPLKCPPGSNGMVPQLSFYYDSRSGNGMMGMGWNVKGLSAITRSGNDIYHDGIVTPVSMTNSDGFELDGVRMATTSGTNGSNGATYHLEAEDFSVIYSYGTAGNGPQWFKVVSKGGSTMEFGNTEDSRMMTDDGTTVVSWRLNRIIDQFGNYIDFKYDNLNRDFRISEISYTGNMNTYLQPYSRISFSYAERNDKNKAYEAGNTFNTYYLLDKVTITAENGQMFKMYQFGYGNNGISSFLGKVTETGSDGTALNATLFTYGTQPADLNITTSDVVNGQTAELYNGDFNGDGFADLLVAERQFDNGFPYNTGFKVYTKEPNASWFHLTKTVSLPNTYYTIQNVAVPNSVMFESADFNGDGFEDIIVSNTHVTSTTRYADAFDIYYGDATGSMNNKVTYSLPSVSGVNYDKIDPTYKFIYLGDFDGDGKTDYLNLLSNTGGFKLFFSSPGSVANSEVYVNIPPYNTNNPANSAYAAGNIEAADKIFVLDLDGDGKHELMCIKGNTTTIYAINKVNSPYYTYRADVIYSGSYPTNQDEVLIGDFNGDRKSDLLTGSATGTSTWHVGYSTGKGFVQADFTFDHTVNKLIPGSNNSVGDNLLVADFNGDGKSDVYDGYSALGYNPVLKVYYSTGNAFYLNNNTYTSTNGSFLHNNPIPIDLNGDGRTEIINRYYYNGDFEIFQFRPQGKENLLAKVVDGMNRKTTFNYGYLTSVGTLYEKGNGAAYPLSNIQAPMSVVAGISSTNGVGGENEKFYFYKDAKVHRTGRGFLGFGSIIEADHGMNISTESLYGLNTTYYTPYVSEINTTVVSNNTPLSHTVNSVSFVNTGGNSFLQHVDNTVYQNLLTGATATTTNTYDNYGNITQAEVNTNNGLEDQVTQQTYVAANTPVPAKPSQVTVLNTRSGQPQVSRKVTYTYTASGAVLKKTTDADKPVQSWKQYDYDSYGNIVRETSGGTSINYAPQTQYSFDDKGRFPVTITNPLGQQSTATFSALWGKPLTQMGIDGQTTTYAYNGLGDLVQKTVPSVYGSHNISYTKTWDVYNGVWWYSNTLDPGAPDVLERHDIVGQVVKAQKETFNGEWTTVDNTYDASGNLITTTNPYLSWETPLVTTKTYDDLHRIVSSSNTFGTTQYSYSYNNGQATTTVTDPGGRNTSKTTDASGKVITSTDNGGSLVFTYDSWSNQLSVKQYLITLASATYDNYGRKATSFNSDAGTTTYAFDAFNRLTSQTDANGNQHTFEYDILNRITKRTGPEGNTLYEYYGAGNGLANQLKKVTGFNGATEAMEYDLDGNVSKRTQTVNGQTFVNTYTWDKYKRLTNYVLPSGLSIQQQFDASGLLQNVLKGSNLLFGGSDMNGMQQYTSYDLTGGITVDKTYYYGLPLRTYSWPNQDFTLTYDYSTGNIVKRQDDIKHLKEEFTYDNLDRLTGTTVTDLNTNTAQPAINIGYHTGTGYSTSNIISKTDVGTYEYGAGKTHAVSYVSNTPGFISQNQRSITYTPFLRPDKVDENGNSLQLTYDGGYKRIMGQYLSGTTVTGTRYYLDNCDVNVDAAGNKQYVQYIKGGDGICAIVVSQNGTHQVYGVLKDHLGSFLTITDRNGNAVAEQNFDAWGRFRNPTNWTYNSIPSNPSWLSRGFTGHEHMPQFGLINMNARMYDPLLGRMVMPDAALQAPLATQNYNKYTYCMNNPMRYTDPSGNLFWGTVTALTIDFFRNGFSGGFDFTKSGARRRESWAEYDPSRPGSMTNNALRIDAGRFVTDPNLPPLQRAWQLISRFTPREATQAELGNIIENYENLRQNVEGVHYFYGATVADVKGWRDKGTLGVDMGNYIRVVQYDGIAYDHGNLTQPSETVMHEYGHYLQSRRYGLVGYFIGALNSAAHSNESDGLAWDERNASDMGHDYFASRGVDVTGWRDYWPGFTQSRFGFYSDFMQVFNGPLLMIMYPYLGQ
ncbi:SpvB/TcaC N-terminal domain-containing protein [Chitinophagaceae bacterium MMS25-I14]